MWYLRIAGSIYLGYWIYIEFSWWLSAPAFLAGMIVSFPLQLIWDAATNALFPHRVHEKAMAEIFGARETELKKLRDDDAQELDAHDISSIVREMLSEGAEEDEILENLSFLVNRSDAIGIIKTINAEQALLKRPAFLVPDSIAKSFSDLLASEGISPGHQLLLEQADIEPKVARDFLLAFMESLENPAENYPARMKLTDGTPRQRSSVAALVDTANAAIKAGENLDTLALRVCYGAGADIRDVRRLFEKVL